MNWVFPISKRDYLFELNGSIRRKTLQFVNDRLKKDYRDYLPWMSNVAHLEELSPLFEGIDFIPKDKKVLSEIAQYYDLERKDGHNVYPGPLKTGDYTPYSDALEYVISTPSLRPIFADIVNHIIPLNPEIGSVQSVGVGSSTLLARGAIFLSIPNMKKLSCIQLAINIAHELGHQCLMVYQTADRIIKDDLSMPVYSYIRKKDRPIIQSFHATFALAFMTEFLQNVDRKNLNTEEKEFVQNELLKTRDDFKNSLRKFKNSQFTPLGKALLKELREYAGT